MSCMLHGCPLHKLQVLEHKNSSNCHESFPAHHTKDTPNAQELKNLVGFATVLDKQHRIAAFCAIISKNSTKLLHETCFTPGNGSKQPGMTQQHHNSYVFHINHTKKDKNSLKPIRTTQNWTGSLESWPGGSDCPNFMQASGF